MDKIIFEIAQKHFFIETLETRNLDRLDFHDVSVWSMKAALEEAFKAGQEAAKKSKKREKINGTSSVGRATDF